jgi:hypothetical protein
MNTAFMADEPRKTPAAVETQISSRYAAIVFAYRSTDERSRTPFAACHRDRRYLHIEVVFVPSSEGAYFAAID